MRCNKGVVIRYERVVTPFFSENNWIVLHITLLKKQTLELFNMIILYALN